jgi:hypothetical protein
MSLKIKSLWVPVVLSFLLANCTPVNFSAPGASEKAGDGITPESTPTPTPPGGGTPTPTVTPPGGGTPTPTTTPCCATPTATPTVSPTVSPTVTPTVTATPTPGSTPTPTPTTSHRVTYNSTVPIASNNVDILLIIDDSGSMENDQKKLSGKLSTFASMLENQAILPIDWQMCVTVTRAQSVPGRTGTFWGASINWVGYTPPAGTPQYVLKKGATNLNDIFKNTINAIGAGVAGSNDERGLKAAYKHFYNGDPNASDGSGCYRKGSSVAVVVISDEDERSVGGVQSRVKSAAPMYEAASSYQVLETEDMPSTLLGQARGTFGQNVRFTFNSIVVSDNTCEATQDAEKDSRGVLSASHLGTKYIEMSHLTAGGIGSICDADYSSNLNLFKDKISNSLASLTLECSPIANSLVVKVNGVQTNDYTLTGANLKFNSAVSEGKQVNLVYDCY